MLIRSRSFDVSPESPTTPSAKVRKPQKSGLLARLFVTRMSKSSENISLNIPSRSPSPEPAAKVRSSPTRDTFVGDVKRALFAQMRSTAGKVVFNSATPPRSPTPELIFGGSSGASTPISSGVCTPVTARFAVNDTPAVKPSGVKRYGSWRSVVSAPITTSTAEPSPRPAKSVELPKPIIIVVPAPAPAPAPKPISINRPKHRPCQSKSSQWRRSMYTPTASSPSTPSAVSIHKDVADELLVMKNLKPLPRFNPFVRPRAESLSSIVDRTRRRQPNELAGPCVRARRNSTMSSLPGSRKEGFRPAVQFVM